MHSSKSWRKNCGAEYRQSGLERVLLRGRRRGCHCFDDDAFDKSGEIFKLSLTFQLDDTQHLSVDNISPPTGEYHHQRQLRLDRRVRKFVESNQRVTYVAKLAELFSRSRQRIPTRFRAHVSDIFLEKYSEEGDERDRVSVGGGMRGRVVHRV